MAVVVPGTGDTPVIEDGLYEVTCIDTEELSMVDRMRDALQGELVRRQELLRSAGNFASALLTGNSVEPIAEALRRPKLRGQAQQYLVELAAGRRVNLSAYIQDPDPRMRADMLDALGLARDPASLPLVTPLVADPDPQVARAADRAIARLQ